MEQSRRRPLKVGIFLPYAEQMMAEVTPGWSELKGLAQCVKGTGFDSL